MRFTFFTNTLQIRFNLKQPYKHMLCVCWHLLSHTLFINVNWQVSYKTAVIISVQCFNEVAALFYVGFEVVVSCHSRIGSLFTLDPSAFVRQMKLCCWLQTRKNQRKPFFILLLRYQCPLLWHFYPFIHSSIFNETAVSFIALCWNNEVMWYLSAYLSSKSGANFALS